MHDSHAPQQRHVDGHVGLRHGVHGAGGEGGLEGDVAGEFGGEVDGAGGEADVARQQQEVVVGQAADLGVVHQGVDGDAVAVGVGFEEGEGLGGVLLWLFFLALVGVAVHLGRVVVVCECGLLLLKRDSIETIAVNCGHVVFVVCFTDY